MKGLFDLRVYKNVLRARYRPMRKNMTPEEKSQKDERILGHIISTPIYRDCKLLLTYVSTDEEINTKPLIEKALADGKQVAVPYCVSGTREMEFYRISSLDELIPRTFGVLEPVAKKENKITNYRFGLCVLPGIAFDRMGYRLGYGGGYYDRFLSRHYKGTTVGLCYHTCMVHRLKRGHYDVPCRYIVTEQGFRKAVMHSKSQKSRASKQPFFQTHIHRKSSPRKIQGL